MNIIADLQLHSKYSRAVSKEMTLSGIYSWAYRKGINLVATGDWTHPLWMKEITENLVAVGNGTFRLKDTPPVNTVMGDKKLENNDINTKPLFLLASEVSCIYSQGKKGRRIHTLIWVPTIESALKINKEMTRQGCNLLSDGRPIIGLSSIAVAELVFSIEPKALVIPAHCWTPWFAVFGAMSGFNSISECFGEYADRIFAVETGLSSNPAMNWQIQELDNRSILSFSDAHSGPKLGREATVFGLDQSVNKAPLGYDDIFDAISQNPKSRCEVKYTIEFYPEEGKYHFTGHRNCNIRWGPQESREKGMSCPVCGKPLTQGVVQRVAQLSARTEKDVEVFSAFDGEKLGIAPDIAVYRSKKFPERKPYIMLVPLNEIISECIGSPVSSKKVIALYDKLIMQFGTEFNVLLNVPVVEIQKIAGDRISQGIAKVRKGDIVIDPGYDGVFGVVKLWKDDKDKPLIDSSKQQLSIF